jgi:predicted amidophosphoribosyltransferase
MIFIDKQEGLKEDTVDLWKLGNYYPYWNMDGSRNERFDAHSNQIIELKKRNKDAISFFYQKLDKIISKNVTICVVPSSDAANFGSGIRELAQSLSRNHRFDATHCLRRHTTIPKAAKGGPRNIQTHKNTICVEDVSLIRGKEVFLLDDVATSKSSINACEQLLLEAGAKKVVKLVLGYTTR